MSKDSTFTEAQRNLFAAISRGEEKDVEKAIRDGAKINEQNPVNNLTPLQFAAATRLNNTINNTKCAKVLIDNGADISARADGTSSPFSLAIGNDKIELMRLIVNHHGFDELSEHPLHCAIAHDKSDCLEILLTDFVMSIKMMNDEDMTPLHLAAKLGRNVCAEILLSHNNELNKCDVNALDPDGRTPLHYAFNFDRPELAELLLSYGADPDLTDRHGRSAISYAKNPATAVACRDRARVMASAQSKGGDTI